MGAAWLAEAPAAFVTQMLLDALLFPLFVSIVCGEEVTACLEDNVLLHLSFSCHFSTASIRGDVFLSQAHSNQTVHTPAGQ